MSSLESLRDAHKAGSDVRWLVDEYEAHRLRTNAFFAMLAAEARKPHCGEHFKDFVRTTVMRATEARIYDPEASL